MNYVCGWLPSMGARACVWVCDCMRCGGLFAPTRMWYNCHFALWPFMSTISPAYSHSTPDQYQCTPCTQRVLFYVCVCLRERERFVIAPKRRPGEYVCVCVRELLNNWHTNTHTYTPAYKTTGEWLCACRVCVCACMVGHCYENLLPHVAESFRLWCSAGGLRFTVCVCVRPAKCGPSGAIGASQPCNRPLAYTFMIALLAALGRVCVRVCSPNVYFINSA